jgi:oligopeptide/dipeptide ABC transporter ATP-binding protein
MNPATPLLEAQSLSVRHQLHHRLQSNGGEQADSVEAVRQVSLSVMAGEILAIVGESGCGKSSLAKALMGLLPATSGAVLYRGAALGNLNTNERHSWRREIQLIFQDPHSALSPRRKIIQSLEEPLQLQARLKPGDYQERILAALADVNLATDILQRYPHQLSGGQKQRLALARALLCHPVLIIADEPFSALDVSEQARLLALIRRLREEKQIAFLLIAHDLAVVQQLADRVAVMYLGQLMELAPAQQFFSHAAHPYSQALLRATQINWHSNGDSHCESPGEPQPALGGEPPSALTPPPGCVFHTRCNQRLELCSGIRPEEITINQAGNAGMPHRVQCHLYARA